MISRRGSTREGFFTLHGIVNKLCRENHLTLALESIDLLTEAGILISRDVLHTLLHQCFQKKDLKDAKHIHHLIQRNGFFSVPLFTDQIIRLFTICGSLSHAHQAFLHASKITKFTWHAIIYAYIKFGYNYEAMDMYAKMQTDGIMPDKHMFSCMLTACGSLGALPHCQILHIQITMMMAESECSKPEMLHKGRKSFI